ncbi:MAG: UDP-N-acetylmuramoyl-L-alanyl-D-glutamate--2,6-diaminopimelate ligase [Bacteroidetes bacterium]|nr:MAG: UDP-N-acetylmuramoyl-L-alanyl-D-glutamate--2,6-diaminopimelate ligase [Bacteroidota bacterium]PIE88170.1 MAG: UDP-N-acetylmuramoyl-L-alanyl-D-glutamate--2,6-diaminopimelate ligase [Bacteroidota bacterium]
MQQPKEIFIHSRVVKVLGQWKGMPRGVCIDSRKVREGWAFVAIKGTLTDGHQYISQAIAQGATTLICEKEPKEAFPESTCVVVVEKSSVAAGELAAAFYKHPSKQLKLVGVTGTNGKTTIATLLHHLFTALGYKTGLISTIHNKIGERVLPSTHTTPDAITLQATIADMVAENCSYCFMEVSSHAIAQDRVAGLSFDGGIFTNLTHDHLDYHKTFSAYLSAKKSFFDHLPHTAFALTNADDKNGLVMTQNTTATVKRYGVRNMADFKTKILENSFTGLHLNLDQTELWSRLCGSFNAWNLTAVYGAAVLLGQQKEEILIALSNAPTVEGRFDLVTSKDQVTAIIDYAHTPDALKNILQTINDIRAGQGQLITVMGAGGDRDRSKRSPMGSIASRLSDQLILTSDNPRTEDPETILAMLMQGVEISDRRKVLQIVHREEAIKAACALARAGDTILVAGKGHEKYQEINGVRHPFDDKAIIQTIFKGGE